MKITATSKIYKAKWIGSFFLLAFLAYGLGRSFFENDDLTEKYIGAFLILANSIIVLIIGLFLRKTLQQYNALVANSYFLTRVFESIALASVTLSLVSSLPVSSDLGYFLAMFALGLGSIPMCVVLYRHKLLPKWLALWGVSGYAIFSFGFFMELIGENWSMYLLVPGGLWEITFALWLIIKR